MIKTNEQIDGVNVKRFYLLLYLMVLVIVLLASFTVLLVLFRVNMYIMLPGDLSDTKVSKLFVNTFFFYFFFSTD